MKKSGKMTFAAVLCIIVCIAAAVLYMFLEPAGEETSGKSFPRNLHLTGRFCFPLTAGPLRTIRWCRKN